MTVDKPNHIYFANRANAYLEINDYQACIENCDIGITIDSTYIKSYFRKSKALMMSNRFKESLSTIH